MQTEREPAVRMRRDGIDLEEVQVPRSWVKLLDESDLAALDDICAKPTRVSAKYDFVLEKSAGNQLHVLVEGWAARYLTGPSGARQTISIGLPGDLLDIDRVYLEAPRYGLTALTHCRFITLDRARLHALMASNPRIASAIGFTLAIDNSMLSEGATRLGRRTSRERFAHFLCETITRLDQIESPKIRGYKFPITQEQIADALGLTAVHVNRTLQDMRAEGLFEWRAQRLKILEWDRLQAIGDFDPSYLNFEDKVLRAARCAAEGYAMARTGESSETAQLELRHRFKNLVALVQSLVRQTLRNGVAIEDAREALNTRLEAVGRSIEVLAQNEWKYGSLRETVHQTLALSRASDQINCEGPDILLNGQALMTLALALHELQTNALKYGALSIPAGRVKLFWKVVDGDESSRLWMQWSETGGPLVEKPKASGFGTRLISRATAHAIGGETVLDYTPEGLTWLLLAPLDPILAGQAGSAPSGTSARKGLMSLDN